MATQKLDFAKMEGAIQLPPDLQEIFKKAVLSGDRIMFDKQSHGMFLEQIQKEGDMLAKFVEGVQTLIGLLWKQSNFTLPPQLVWPVTYTMVIHAFKFLHDAGLPEATPEFLGQAMEATLDAVTQAFGGSMEQIQQAAQQNKGKGGQAGQAPAPAAAPTKKPAGLMAAAQGAK